MKKKFLIWLIILMVISLSGIMTVQFFWFNNPLQMNNELFRKIVSEAIAQAAQQFEINAEVRTIDEGLSETPAAPEKNSSLGSKSDRNQKAVDINSASDSVSSSGEKKYSEKQPAQKSPVPGVQNWSVRRPVDVKKLKVLTEEALIKMGIDIPFNYAIFSNDTIIQSDLGNSYKQYWYKTKLFSDDIFSRDLYMGICFPGAHIYISHISSVKVLSFVSIFLVFVVFCLSLFLIIKLKKASAGKTDFINNMAHEFKTPLTTVGMAADAVLSEEVISDPDRVRFYSRLIKAENKRMIDQVEKLLQAARIGRKELYFKLQDTDIHELINKAIEGISIQIEKRNGKIETNFQASNPVIPTDPLHFKNLINNLLDNANKYSPESPQIKVSTANDTRGVYITVEDKGIGISKKMQSKIFEKFYRTTSEDIDYIKGFGLGLSYIKAILKLNKGKIKVYSETGKGSRFVVFLPY